MWLLWCNSLSLGIICEVMCLGLLRCDCGILIGVWDSYKWVSVVLWLASGAFTCVLLLFCSIIQALKSQPSAEECHSFKNYQS